MGQVYPNAGYAAARIAGEDPAFDALAARVKLTILAVAAPHTKTGHYDSSVRIRSEKQKGVRHRVVEVTDPEALKIEYGHWWITPLGVKVKWVKGIRIVNRAYDLLKGS